MRNLLILYVSTLCTIACSNDRIVYSYVVVKPTTEDSVIHQWRPVMKVTYRVGEKSVISEVASLVDEYEDCLIQNKNNWQCQYEDGRGKNIFGFNNGKYWQVPIWGDDVRHVTRWEFNVIRCKWFQNDSGNIKGMVSCLQTYI